MNEKFLLIKINELPTSTEELLKKASGKWAIKQEKLHNVRYMIVCYKKEIVAIYEILSVQETDEVWAHGKRLSFDIIPTNEFRKFLNLELETMTSNPATIILEPKLKFK